MSQGNFDYEYKFENTYGAQDMNKTNEEKISFTELGKFKIDPNVTFVLSNEENAIFIDCELLNLHACGLSLEEAKKDLLSDIEYVWGSYVDANPKELDDKAKEYAKTFAQHISRI